MSDVGAAVLLAEVIDKIELPWAASSIVVAAFVAFICAAMARVPARAARLPGAAIAVGWGALRLGLDPWCDPAVGVALRNELGLASSMGYLAAMFACALLPIAAFGVARKTKPRPRLD